MVEDKDNDEKNSEGENVSFIHDENDTFKDNEFTSSKFEVKLEHMIQMFRLSNFFFLMKEIDRKDIKTYLIDHITTLKNVMKKIDIESEETTYALILFILIKINYNELTIPDFNSEIEERNSQLTPVNYYIKLLNKNSEDGGITNNVIKGKVEMICYIKNFLIYVINKCIGSYKKNIEMDQKKFSNVTEIKNKTYTLNNRYEANLNGLITNIYVLNFSIDDGEKIEEVLKKKFKFFERHDKNNKFYSSIVYYIGELKKIREYSDFVKKQINKESENQKKDSNPEYSSRLYEYKITQYKKLINNNKFKYENIVILLLFKIYIKVNSELPDEKLEHIEKYINYYEILNELSNILFINMPKKI
jgi:hypothetical protein